MMDFSVVGQGGLVTGHRTSQHFTVYCICLFIKYFPDVIRRLASL